MNHPIRSAASVLSLLVALVGCGGKPAPTTKPPDDTAYHVRLANSLLNGGRAGEAIATLDEAIGKEPDNPALYNFKGQICLRAGRYEEAVEALNKALEVDPQLTDAHNNLGAAYMELDRTGEAQQQFEKALADPGYPTPEKVYLNLGLLFASQGRDREAIEAFRQSVGIDPKYFKAHYQLASILERIGELIEAAREYEVAEPSYRQSGEYWFRRGMTYYLLDDRQKAKDSLLRVRSVAPGSASAAKADDLLETLN